MLRKSLLLCVIAPLLFVVGTFIAACTRGKAKVCAITLSGYRDYYQDTATLSGVFKFHVSAARPAQLCFASAANPFITPSYALTKCYQWENDLDTTTFSLFFDKNIVMGTDTLFAMVSILQHKAFEKLVPITGGTDCASVEYSIGTEDTATMSHMVFETGIYRAFFTCTTTDGKALLAECYIRFEQ